jgi:hypothetical protein
MMKVMEHLRKLHNEKLLDPYFSRNIIWVIKSEVVLGGACDTYEGEKKWIQSFGGGRGRRPEGDH